MWKTSVWNIACETYLYSATGLVPKEPHPYDALHEAHEHSHAHPHERSHSHPFAQSGPGNGTQQRVSDSDMDKLRSTLKQFVRDWSAEVETISQILFSDFAQDSCVRCREKQNGIRATHRSWKPLTHTFPASRKKKGSLTKIIARIHF